MDVEARLAEALGAEALSVPSIDSIYDASFYDQLSNSDQDTGE
jgi:hypothetical protein